MKSETCEKKTFENSALINNQCVRARAQRLSDPQNQFTDSFMGNELERRTLGESGRDTYVHVRVFRGKNKFEWT